MNEVVILLLVLIVIVLILLFVGLGKLLNFLLPRMKKLEKRMDELIVHSSEPNSIIIPLKQPNITENGIVKTEINKRFDKIEQKGINLNLRLRNIEEKFEDEKLEALLKTNKIIEE